MEPGLKTVGVITGPAGGICRGTGAADALPGGTGTAAFEPSAAL